jgi:uncharacterized membrane protein YfhO
MRKKLLHFVVILGAIIILILPMTLLITFGLGIQYFELESSFSRICWAYFHFASIYGLYWLSSFISIYCKVNGYGVIGKYQNHFIYAFSILAILLCSYVLSQNDEASKIERLNNAITIFCIMILPCIIGISQGLKEESKMTNEEKRKLKNTNGY